MSCKYIYKGNEYNLFEIRGKLSNILLDNNLTASEVMEVSDFIGEQPINYATSPELSATLGEVKNTNRSEENGATFNLDGSVYNEGGLVVPLTSVNTTQDEISIGDIKEFIETNKDKIGGSTVKVGIYKFEKSDKMSIDLNIVAPTEHRDIAIEVGAFLGQESLFDLETFENVKTGETGGNPRTLTAEEFKIVAEMLGRGENPVPTLAAVSPSHSSNYANLTEDGEGNFVFFHRGAKGYETINPSTGIGTKTSNAEASSLGKVGGLAMYYTRVDDTELVVPYQQTYAVKIPKEKVYDFNSDRLGLLAEAKKLHDAEFPGKAFDKNTQVAYITKVAKDKGFDMVVSEWSGKTRAQTTQKMNFVDTEERNGSQVTKEFEETYISNNNKGWQSIIPKTKKESLQEVFDEISKYREYQDKKYDSLYHIRDKSFRSKMTQEEVGTLINKSEMPQSLKDKYNEVVSAEELTRKSIIPTQTTFSRVVKDERVANQSKTIQGISDVDLVINNVYPKSQESNIKDKFDECRI